jgi:branched-chain amino acid aminotransferase
MQFMIQTWKLTTTSAEEIIFSDSTTLDAITRQLPDGYYSTFRTFDEGTHVLALSAHLRRLFEPVSGSEVDVSSLRRHLRALLERYRPDEARVRLIMTKQGHTYVAIEPLKQLPREVYEKGVRVETTEMHRERPRLKSTAFIAASDLERKHIAREGIFEALLVKDGRILEGMTSNFFYVGRDGIPTYLGTARDDILLGVTRETVLEIARGRGLEVRYAPLKRDQLADVSEAFITSSSRGVVPVVQIDQVTIGQGSPGPVTKQLAIAYEAYVLARAERI